MDFHKVLWWHLQIDNEFKEFERNSDFKIINVMKPDSIICFWALHFMISIEDLNLISKFEYSTQQQRS